MDDEKQAANAGEETPEVESAPIEETEAPEDQTSEKTEIAESEEAEKMVSLSALQQERQRRKEAELYIKELQSNLPRAQAEETDPRDPSQYVTREELEYQRKMEREWYDAEREFAAELEANPKIKEYAEVKRQSAVINELRYLSPKQAVAEVIKDFRLARAEGQKAAQESIEIQKMGQLESGTAKINKSSRAEELRQVIATSRDKKAVERATMELLRNRAL